LPPDHAEAEAFMNSLNNIFIEGNLVTDPTLRSTPQGTPVCTLRLASNRYYKQDSGFERETGFFNVEVWANLAEHCCQVGHKGQGVRVTGRLKYERWSGQDGKPHSTVTIVAEHVAFKPEFKRDNSPGKPGIHDEAELAASEYTDVQTPEDVEAVVF
jgi:single-strand DNA-binding protein